MLNSLPSHSVNLNFDRMHVLTQAALSIYCKLEPEIMDSETADLQGKESLSQVHNNENEEMISHLRLSHVNLLRRIEQIEPERKLGLSDQQLSPVLSRSILEKDENLQGITPINIWCQGQD
jgi:hypothetical protein